MNRENTQNKGFSLVEVLVVIAIISIMGGVSLWIFGALPQRQVSNCAESIVTEIERGRTDAMSYTKVSLRLYKNSEGVYAEEIITKGTTEEKKVTKVGDSVVNVKCYFGASRAEEIGENPLVINYKRSTGGFEKGGKLNALGTEEPLEEACTKIEVYDTSGKHKVTIGLSKITGNVSYE